MSGIDEIHAQFHGPAQQSFAAFQSGYRPKFPGCAHKRIAPYPSRFTGTSPPSRQVPAEVVISGLAAEGNVVVHVVQVGPSGDVRAMRRGGLPQSLKNSSDSPSGTRFSAASDHASISRRVFVRLARANPFEDVAVALAGRELGPERFRIDAEELEGCAGPAGQL